MIILNYIRNNMSDKKAESIIDKANKEADKIKRNYLLDAKEEAHKLKIDFEKEMKEKKSELKESEERLLLRESNIDKRDQTLQNREQMLEERENNLVNKQREIQKEQDKVEEIKKEQVDLLEKIAGYSKNEARDLVMKKVEEMMNLEIAAYIKDREKALESSQIFGFFTNRPHAGKGKIYCGISCADNSDRCVFFHFSPHAE